MNIGSLIRGLLGEQKPGEAKTLELKPGQVVRGVVMNVSEDGQEAVVQIQGVQVKAKLETPLRAGETALLQVQPPGEGGTAVLKPLSQTPGQPLSPSSMAEVLDFAGLPDTKENREMIKGMQNAGVPLTKDNIALFREALAVKPPQIPAAEWAESVAIAFHRGLPITPESVKGLHQAVFGPQLHQLPQSLDQRLASALSAGSGGLVDAGKQARSAKSATALAQRPPRGTATRSRREWRDRQCRTGRLRSAGAADQAAGPAAATRGELARPWASGGTAACRRPTRRRANGAGGQAKAAGLPPPTLARSRGWGGLKSPVRSTSEGLRGPVRAPRAKRRAVAAPRHQPGSLRRRPAAARAGGSRRRRARSECGLASIGNRSNGSRRGACLLPQPRQPSPRRPSIPARHSCPWGSGTAPSMPGTLATPGNAANTANANQQAVPNAQAGAVNQQGLTRPVVPSGQQNSVQGVQQAVMASTQTGESALALQDTLKGVLLQVLSSQETPPALKEAAQQLVQHLTGQRLY